jgi:hypothetical protein
MRPRVKPCAGCVGELKMGQKSHPKTSCVLALSGTPTSATFFDLTLTSLYVGAFLSLSSMGKKISVALNLAFLNLVESNTDLGATRKP